MAELILCLKEYGFLFGSIVIFAIGIGMSILFYYREKIGQKQKDIPPVLWLTVGTAIALFLLNVGGNQIDWRNAGSIIDGLLTALLDIIGTFGGERGADATQALSPVWFEETNLIFNIYADILHLVASGVIVVFLVKIVTKLFPRWVYLYWSKGHLYVFSGVSEREILLAEDIRSMEKQKEKKKSVIVFLQSSEGETKVDTLSERMQAVTKYIFHDDVVSLPIPEKYLKKGVDYFLLKEVDEENINDALLLADKYEGQTYDVGIHVLSDNPEMEYLLDSVTKKGNCDMWLISETKSMLYQLLDQRPLFLGARDQRLDILIIGAGRTGQEAAKICSWCGYTKDLTPNIWLIDKLEEPFLKLQKECPEMMQCGSNVQFKQIDVETTAFLDFLRAHREIGYVICALGDEHLNLRTALDVRAISYEEGPYDEASKEFPLINVLLNNEVLYKSCEKLNFTIDAKSQKKRSYHLNAFGSFKEFYTWKNMGNSYLEGSAVAVHRFYSGTGKAKADVYDEYKTSNYNRYSSMATGLHSKYKAYAILCEIKGRKVLEEEWSKEVDESMRVELLKYLYDTEIKEPAVRTKRVEELAKLEHNRWNAYMRATGWKTATKAQVDSWKEELNSSKNIPAKMQPNLVPWEELDDGTKEYDENLIWNLPFILDEASKYDKTIGENMSEVQIDVQDMGNYTDADFEAICFWHHYNHKKGKKLYLSGSAQKICTFVKQALLMQIFTEGPSECHIYCDKVEESEFFTKEVSECFKIAKTEQEKIYFHKEEMPEPVQGENVERCNVDERKYKKEFVLEFKASIIEIAKTLNANYNEVHKNDRGFVEKKWEDLSDFLKGSNICAASFIKIHRRNFANEMELEKMAEVEHERWCRYHYLNGWKKGEKNPDKKTHTCLVPFQELPDENKQNDRSNVRRGLQLMQKG